jgi:hypothetical protein
MGCPAPLDDCASRSRTLANSDGAEVLAEVEVVGLPAKLARTLSDVNGSI